MKREPFIATCDRCLKKLPCLTVVLMKKTLVEEWRELANYCAKCRQGCRKYFRWPEPTADDKKHAEMDEAEKLFSR